MNKERRKRIQEIKDQIESIQSDIECIMSEEEDYRDNIPENLQGSERYEMADTAVNALSCAIDSISEACNSLEEAME